MNKKESNILNIMQCIAVLLVVAGHSIETPSPSLFWQYVHKFIYSFHMPYLCCLVVICFFIVDIAIF